MDFSICVWLHGLRAWFAEMTSDFCGSVAAGSKVMVVWGELQAGGEALQVRPKSIWLLLAQVLLKDNPCQVSILSYRALWRSYKSKLGTSRG